jgi:hypothetical protein
MRFLLRSHCVKAKGHQGKIDPLVRGGRMLSACALLLLPVGSPWSARAQLASKAAVEAALPDAPTPTPVAESASQDNSVQHPNPAAGLSFKIGPWRDPKALDLSMPVVPLSAGDKMKLSFQEQLTPFAAASMAVAAGWEHLRDSNPKYGSNSTAFAQRLGAAALRQTSQAVFSDGVYASVFRQDPRYYRMASGSVKTRIWYAASRMWRTRNDSCTPAVNYSLLFGHATAQALTLAYYPDRSQSGRVAIAGFGWSLLGTVAGNQYHEFWPDILEKILRRPPEGPRPTSVPVERGQGSTE